MLPRSFVPYEAVVAFSILATEDRFVADAGFGYDPDSLVVIVPGAEWQFNIRPIDGAETTGPTFVTAALAPILSVVGDPTQGIALRLIPSIVPLQAQLRVTTADLVTPAPLGAAFVVTAVLLRKVGPTVAPT